MYILTTLSYKELGALIRDKRVSLNNAELLFGKEASNLSEYFKDRVGYPGYVVGLCGRLNPKTAGIFTAIDKKLKTGERVILEAEINDNEVVSYSLKGVTVVAEALEYGLPEEDIIAQLEESANAPAEDRGPLEVLCVPYIDIKGKIKVTGFREDLLFDVEDITFIKIKPEEIK